MNQTECRLLYLSLEFGARALSHCSCGRVAASEKGTWPEDHLRAGLCVACGLDPRRSRSRDNPSLRTYRCAGMDPFPLREGHVAGLDGLEVPLKAYENYLYRYVKCRGIADKKIWEFVAEEMARTPVRSSAL